MASETLNDYAVTNQWTDLLATLTSAASVDTAYQCVSRDRVQMVAGGASAPTGKTGIILAELDSVQLNCANLWVKNFDGNGAVISVTKL